MALNISILGCGHIAKRHAEHITNQPKANLVGVFDIDSLAAEKLASNFNSTCFENLDELLRSKTELVAICTPSGLHADQAITCMEAGKHVLVEKPMALSSSDAIKMKEAADKNGVQLFVVKQNRYNPPVQWIKKALENGELGDIKQISVNCFWNRNASYYESSSWKGTKQLDGGVLFNQFSHFIDVLYYLFGQIGFASGIVSNKSHADIIEFEDCGTITFQFLNGAIGSLDFSVNSYEQNMEGSITIFADNGTVKIGGKYLNAVEYINAKSLELGELPISAPANEYGFYQGSMSNHNRVYDNVIDVLTGDGKIMTSANDGIEVVKFIETLYNSAKWV